MNDSRLELLISKVVDDDASQGEWDELVAAGDADPAIWRQLAQAHRDQSTLSSIIARVTAVADAVDAPTGEHEMSPVIEVLRMNRSSTRALGGWTGWAAAAAILLAWVIASVQPPRHATNVTAEDQQAGFFIPVSSSQEALDAHLAMGREEGTVLSETPRRLILQARRDPSGEGYELIFVMQIVERTVVPDLYQYQGQDERGRPTLVRWRHDAAGGI